LQSRKERINFRLENTIAARFADGLGHITENLICAEFVCVNFPWRENSPGLLNRAGNFSLRRNNMGMTDPIADMLTRIRNANKARFKTTNVHMSQMNVNIAKVLKKAGYINNYDKVKDEKGQQMLEIILKYPDAKNTVITNIKRISKPGRRIYVNSDSIPKVLNGLGISILSTSKGVITDAEARELNVGGEILCNVW
jgi:small subunit ribosomal protein S8